MDGRDRIDIATDSPFDNSKPSSADIARCLKEEFPGNFRHVRTWGANGEGLIVERFAARNGEFVFDSYGRTVARRYRIVE